MLNNVKRFYQEILDYGKRDILSEICHPDFTFRGSLGIEKTGHDEFWDYVLLVKSGLSGYFCDIEEAVSERNKVFAKMRFGGIRTGRFMDFDPTGLKVSWRGSALFTFREDGISDLWVLGDVHSLLNTLAQNQAEYARNGDS
ncbi:MAG: ester cyclase [Verrucomicrobia bacterium]|nr:ester cyclase [Verrucomicrobiota bacterium]